MSTRELQACAINMELASRNEISMDILIVEGLQLGECADDSRKATCLKLVS